MIRAHPHHNQDSNVYLTQAAQKAAPIPPAQIEEGKAVAHGTKHALTIMTATLVGEDEAVWVPR